RPPEERVKNYRPRDRRAEQMPGGWTRRRREATASLGPSLGCDGEGGIGDVAGLYGKSRTPVGEGRVHGRESGREQLDGAAIAVEVLGEGDGGIVDPVVGVLRQVDRARV